jgi:hypothetical protein
MQPHTSLHTHRPHLICTKQASPHYFRCIPVMCTLCLFVNEVIVLGTLLAVVPPPCFQLPCTCPPPSIFNSSPRTHASAAFDQLPAGTAATLPQYQPAGHWPCSPEPPHQGAHPPKLPHPLPPPQPLPLPLYCHPAPPPLSPSPPALLPAAGPCSLELPQQVIEVGC